MIMEDKDILLEIDNLRVNFYTYQGVVKALDGINFRINKAETLGLVGETGCGKSVTASSITKLILSPPGKIEDGNVYFLEPPDVRAKRKAFEREYQALYDKLPLKDKKRVTAEYGPRATGFKKKVSPPMAKEIEETVPQDRAPTKLVTIYFNKKAAKVPKTDKTTSEALRKSYDLLSKSNEYMQLIRGKFISMIFQEPTSALNPVFTAGDQIAEVILLHRKSEMAKRVRARLKKEIDQHKQGTRPRKITVSAKRCAKCGATAEEAALKCSECGSPDFKELKKGLFVDRPSGEKVPPLKIKECSICGAQAHSGDQWCENCGSEFYGIISWRLRPILLRTYDRIFAALEKNAKSRYISTLGRIPIFNRFNKELNAEAIREAARMLEIVRIPDPREIAHRYPHELSGGMQQRVMIAIALACNPKLLIADEPTTALDVTIQAQILKLMRDLKQQYGSSILLITHNLGVVAEMCDRVGVMYAGTMAEIGDVRTIFKSPLHPYTMSMMKAVPSAHQDTERLFTIRGSVPNLVFPPSGCRFHPRCDFAKQYCTKVKPELVEIEKGHFVACHKAAGVKDYAASARFTG